jgi:hypothetical protein
MLTVLRSSRTGSLITIKYLTRFHGGNTIWEDDDIPAIKWRLLDLSADGEILMKLIEMARTRIHYPDCTTLWLINSRQSC